MSYRGGGVFKFTIQGTALLEWMNLVQAHSVTGQVMEIIGSKIKEL